MREKFFWSFVHNKIAHGVLMGWPWKDPAWVISFHDYTANRLGEDG